MANPEVETSERFQADKAEKELTEYLRGAEIGSPKLLAYSDEVRYRELREMIMFLEGSNKKTTIQHLFRLQIEYALLNHQIQNRCAETKGYAKASSDVSDLLDKIEEGYRRQAMNEGVSSKSIGTYLDDTYRAFMFKMLRVLTGEESPSPEK